MATLVESSRTISDSIPFASWPSGESPEGYFASPLGPEERAYYDRNGFLVLDRALTSDQVSTILADTTRLCRNADGSVTGISPADPVLSDDEVLRSVLCIHFPHKLSPSMHEALHFPAVVQALTTLVGPDVKCMQSMLFIKASGKPGQAWHQDEDYIPTRDRSLIGAWIALDDATVENGCLWVIPGSHRPGVLWKQEWHEDRRFDCSLESKNFPYTGADEVPVEVKKGSVVLFNGYTLHRSLPNRAASGFRRSLVNHYMSAQSLLPWKADPTVAMGMQDYRDIVMVAGTDPYAYKGTEDIAKAFVRPGGQGGCVDWVTREPRPYKDSQR